MSTLENAAERESKARQDGTEEVKAEFAARLTTAVEGALSEVNAKLADSEVQFTGMSEEMQKRLGELSESTGNASVELVADAKREMEALFQVESDQRKLAEEKVLEAIQEQERRAEAERVEREAAEKQLRDELQKELESFNDQRTTAETSLREELNGEMSNALEKQADLLGSSLEEMESSISQLRDDMVGRLDDESGVLIATKEELTNLVGGERKEREAETAEIRAELATQLAASMTETSEGVKDDLARAIEDVRASGVAASESLNERVEQLGHDVAEMKAKQNGEPSVPSVTKEELEALVGDERKEREAGTAELRAELATQLAAGVEEVRANVVAASESLNERVEQLNDAVRKEETDRKVSVESLKGFVQGFVAANSPRPVAAQGGE